MRRLVLVALTSLVILLSAAPGLAAEAVSVEDLLADPAAYDATEISLSGELVGDYGFRPDGWMWTQLNDDGYATDPLGAGGRLAGANTGVGIRMPVDMGRSLDTPGGYRVVGPLVVATGEWRFHDSGRGGESYLEVAELRVVTPGHHFDEPANGVVVALAAALLLLGLGLALAARRSRP